MSQTQSQLPLNEALAAFSQGYVERAKSILKHAAESEAARQDMLDVFGVACVRASIAAMEGESATVVSVMSSAGGYRDHEVTTLYLEGLAALARGSSLHTAKIKFEEALRCDPSFVLANLGLAAVEYQLEQYTKSFSHYRTVLEGLGNQSPRITRIGLGLCSYRLRHLSHARKCFERALQVQPDDELAMLALVVVYLDLRLVPRVIDMVRRLHQLLPDNAQVMLRVTNLMYFKAVSQERVKSALQPIEELLNDVREVGTEAEIANADFQSGRLKLAMGDFAAAEAHLQQAMRVLPDLLAARIHYARLLLLSGRHDQASELLMQINESFPNQKEVLQLLAAEAARRGQFEAALEYSNRLIDGVGPSDVISWSLASWCARLDPERASQRMSRAVRLQKELGHEPPAELLANIASLQGSVQELQDMVDRRLGGDFMTNGKPLAIHDIPLVFNLGNLLESVDADRATGLYVFLVKQHPSFRLPYFRLYTMAKGRKCFRQAVMWMTLLLQVYPGDALAPVYIGQAFFEQRRYGTAVKVMRNTQRKSVPLALALGSAYLWYSQQHGSSSLRFLADARDRFAFVLKKDSGNILAAHGLACCLGLDGDYGHCQSLLDRVGELVPNDPHVQLNHRSHLANLKTLSDSFKQAIDCLEAEEDITPLQTSSLAFCYACSNRHSDAIRIMKQVVDANPEVPLLRYNLALLYCASFVSSVAAADALLESEGRELRSILEQGLELARQFVQLPPTFNAMTKAQVFLKSVSTYALNYFDSRLNKLVHSGVKQSELFEQQSQHWSKAFSVVEQQRRQEKEEQLAEEQRRREEELEVGRQILADYQRVRNASGLLVLDPAEHLVHEGEETERSPGAGTAAIEWDPVEKGHASGAEATPVADESAAAAQRLGLHDLALEEAHASILAGMFLEGDARGEGGHEAPAAVDAVSAGEEKEEVLTLELGNQ